MWNIIQEAFKHSNSSNTHLDKAQSLSDFFHDKVIETIPDAEPGFEHKRRIILQMSEMWSAFVGSPVSRQSLKFFWLEECLEGGKDPVRPFLSMQPLVHDPFPSFFRDTLPRYESLYEANFSPENLFCAGTYKKILDVVAKPVLAQADVLFCFTGNVGNCCARSPFKAFRRLVGALLNYRRTRPSCACLRHLRGVVLDKRYA